MYEITDVDSTTKALIEAALKSATREFRQRVTFGYWTLSDGLRVFNKSFEISNILSLKIKQIHSSDSGSLQMGCCCSSSAELEFYNPYYSQSSGGSKFTDNVIFIECGIKYQEDDIDENGEVTKEYFYYFPMGYFNTGNPQSDDKWYTVKLTAYDDINTMTEKWNSSLYINDSTEPTVKDLIDETAAKYNLSVEYGSPADFLIQYNVFGITFSKDKASILTEYSDADALGFLAGLAGANVRMNTQGKLWVGFYDKKFDLTVTTDIQWQNGLLKTQEGTYEIASVTAGADDNVYTSGTGKGVQFYNPIITRAQVNNIMNFLSFAEYLPCELEWRGNPCVEAGDLIYVKDENSENFTVRVVEQELDLTGGLFSKIICPTGSDSINFDSVESSIRRELNIQKTALQEAIEKATAALNGSKGGYYELLDTDSDGNPDGWIIKEDEGGTKGIIRANKAGIGLSKDGGKTYKTALTYDGIAADAIVCEDLSAFKATIGGWNIDEQAIYKDYFNDDGSMYRAYYQAPGMATDDVNITEHMILSSQYFNSSGDIDWNQGFYLTVGGKFYGKRIETIDNIETNVTGKNTFAGLTHNRNGCKGSFGIGGVGTSSTIALEHVGTDGIIDCRLDFYSPFTNINAIRSMRYKSKDSKGNATYYYSNICFFEDSAIYLCDPYGDNFTTSNSLDLLCKDINCRNIQAEKVAVNINGKSYDVGGTLKVIGDALNIDL